MRQVYIYYVMNIYIIQYSKTFLKWTCFYDKVKHNYYTKILTMKNCKNWECENLYSLLISTK